MTDMMRVLEVNDNYGIENLKVVERPKPIPGPGQVLVKMHAASLNYRDWGSVGGFMKLPFPIVPLSDGCGIVEAIGDNVTEVKVGDRVASMFFQDWEAGDPTPEKYGSALGSRTFGVAREYAVLRERGVCKVPDFLTDLEVATLPCAALTAWNCIMEQGDLPPGGTVVLLGTGGVSLFGLQFAKAAGYTAIITSSSDEKLARARKLGADETVNYREIPEWGSEIKRRTGGRGADLVIEIGGSNTLKQSVNSLKLGGLVTVIGALAGFESTYDISQVIVTSAGIRGVFVGSRDMFKDMCRAIDLHKIRPVIDTVYPWTECGPAIGAMLEGKHFGKICLDFGI